MTDNLLPKDGVCRLFLQCFEVDTANRLLLNLLERTHWTQENATLFGRRIPVPRLVTFHGDKPYRYSGITHEPSPWTGDLQTIRQVAEARAGTSFNSVLLNYYRDGRDSMGWHSDDERELGPDPIIASISFGGTRKFQLRHKREKDLRQTIDLPHACCLVMAGTMQAHWQHQVPKTTRPSAPRLNLTFRDIKA